MHTNNYSVTTLSSTFISQQETAARLKVYTVKINIELFKERDWSLKDK